MSVELPRVFLLALLGCAPLALQGCAVAMLNGAASASGASSGGTSPGSRTASQKAADDAVSTAVRSKLAANPALKPSNLSVATQDGVVTLGGQVAKVGDRGVAEQAARSVKGVKAVVNRVTVSPSQ